ncbi:MAG: hypothetical protein GY718_12030 [Lentisphaerae bacterium]|nr:hypothetical protein [Lentisphaerota bacterium]
MVKKKLDSNSSVVNCVTKSGGEIKAFKEALIFDNFEITAVEFFLADPIDLYNKKIITSCNGNNAGNPYYTFKVPTPTTQTIENPLEGMAFYLCADEAIVLVGLTPPKAKYFSYKSFVFSIKKEGTLYKTYTSLGDTINLMNINTMDLPDGNNPFSMPVIIVTTADKGINARVQAAAEVAGYDRKIMNTDIIPSAIAKMGLDADCDTFSYLNRTAMFENLSDGEEYQNNSGVVAFRVTPKTTPELDPYPTPTMRIRGTGLTEMDLMLMETVDQLRKAILDRYATYTSDELITEVWLREGYEYIQTLKDGIGVSRDTSYLRTTSFKLPDSPNDFLIVYGVNHAATNKCTYANFITYSKEILNGVACVNSDQFTKSAESFLPGNPMAKYLYVWKIARQSSDDDKENCLKVPMDDFANGIPLSEEMFIGFRAYVEPKTQIGPAWQELIFDRVVKFSK